MEDDELIEEMPPQTVTMKSPSWDMTSPRLGTLRILAAMTLLMPTGEIHMMVLTILMITSSITAKNWMTPAAFSPRDPSTVPKAKQKNMIPRVLVPFLIKQNCGIKIWMISIFDIQLNVHVQTSIYL